nr:hypothetical protein [Solitalea longa]
MKFYTEVVNRDPTEKNTPVFFVKGPIRRFHPYPLTYLCSYFLIKQTLRMFGAL